MAQARVIHTWKLPEPLSKRVEAEARRVMRANGAKRVNVTGLAIELLRTGLDQRDAARKAGE